MTPRPSAEESACVSHPTLRADDWFGDPKTSRSAAAAIEVCLSVCAVRAECLMYTMSLSPQPPGTWAGLSEHQRRRMAANYRKRHGMPTPAPSRLLPTVRARATSGTATARSSGGGR